MLTFIIVWLSVALPVLTIAGISAYFYNNWARKLNPYVKRVWVNALRSGEYEQGYGQLCDEEGKFCVLGVLCDIHSRLNSKPWVLGTHPTFHFHSFHYLGNSCTAPVEVERWAFKGKSCSFAKIGLKPRHAFNQGAGFTLDRLNDCRIYSFCDLADLIEAQL